MSGGKSNNRELGMGHVYRCLNLASNFDRRDTFFVIEDFGGVNEVLKSRGYQKILNLKKNSNVKNDLNNMIDFVESNKIDVIVVDIQTTFIKSLIMPEDIEVGDYTLYIKSTFNGKIGSSSSSFEVIEREERVPFKTKSIYVYLGLVVLVIFILLLPKLKITKLK